MSKKGHLDFFQKNIHFRGANRPLSESEIKIRVGGGFCAIPVGRHYFVGSLSWVGGPYMSSQGYIVGGFKKTKYPHELIEGSPTQEGLPTK